MYANFLIRQTDFVLGDHINLRFTKPIQTPEKLKIVQKGVSE